MQSMDEHGNIKGMTPVSFDALNELASKIREAEKSGAVSHTIGKIPEVGKDVIINGLSYRVEFSDYVKGKLTVKLVCREK